MVDDTTAQLKKALASVEETEAHIKQKIITAPFDGKIGIRQINLGQYLSAGTPIVTLQSLDPLYVQFTLPEQYLSKISYQQPVDIDVSAEGGKTVEGKINAINSKVDQTTRNVLIQATIPNPDFHLYPGMFALVKIWLPQQNDVITLPQTAISYSLHGDSVFIIKKEKSKNDKEVLKVYRQYVTVGERRGDEVSILKGINVGDQVVTSGQLKLQNGTAVVVDNSVEL